LETFLSDFVAYEDDVIVADDVAGDVGVGDGILIDAIEDVDVVVVANVDTIIAHTTVVAMSSKPNPMMS